MQFPTWLYHSKQEARVFRSQKELDEAGLGWQDTPFKDVKDQFLSNEDLTIPELKTVLKEQFKLKDAEIKKLRNKSMLLKRLSELEESN
jgi:hypothetical protein